MRKKLKILLSLSLLIFCLIPLTGCQISINIDNSDNNDNINNDNLINSVNIVHFETVGVYLKIEGNVKAGNQNGLIYLTEEDRPENEKDNLNLSYTYLDYSYDEDVDGTPIGGASFENMPEWNIGTVNFTENANVIQFEMEFTNYSEQMIDVVITPTVQNTLVNVTASSTGATTLTLSSNQTQTYTFTLTLDSFVQPTSGSVSFDVDAGPSSAVLAEITNKNNFSYINLTVNGLYPSDPILVKEGDALLIWSSDINFGISLTLYNSEDTSINNWSELTPGGSLRVTVPELQEGYYFKFLLTPSRT